MCKILYSLFFLLLVLFLAFPAFAKSSNFVSIVNPIRGADFWSLKNQTPQTAVKGQIGILKKQNIKATWLIRFDALTDAEITDSLKTTNDEKGLFLEVTPSWAKASIVNYHVLGSWHEAGSALLAGYERKEREKLIDSAFLTFKKVFGEFPTSVGAWWVDSFSLGYMQQKYDINSAVIVSDQYTTDNYQIWGQYWSTPYYPAKNNALHPAQTLENKLPVVITQWAARDPVNGYGNGVFESTFSVQANDYLDYHNLNTNYFEKLIDIYTKQKFNQFGHVVIGLENSYDWERYASEYENQITLISKKEKIGDLKVVSLAEFAKWYQQNFPNLSPTHLIVADDPLGSDRLAVWFMNPYYRSGWFYNQDGSVFRDIRQYVAGEEELCFKERCQAVNFATFATRVLDEVTYGHKWVIDEGKISDFKVAKSAENFVINYLDEAGKLRTIEFLPRDMSIDGKISSIDGAILNIIKENLISPVKQNTYNESGFNWTFSGVVLKTIKFTLFLLIMCLIPGLFLTSKLFQPDESLIKRVFLAYIVGSVLLTIVFYITSLLNIRVLVLVYALAGCFLFFKHEIFISEKKRLLFLLKFNQSQAVDKLSLLSILVIVAGTFFQNIPTFKNGLVFPFGMGFWGPNTHDGVWHASLTAQLVKGLPSENPIFADTILKNYHFFYDLLVAATVFFTKIPILDLIFRFYPILFSMLLGIGTYYLTIALFKDRIGILKTKVAVVFSLYFVYFAGSFGWIVDYIKEKKLGGESAFWANQSISFNLNPPFAISLLIVIAFFILTGKELKSPKQILVASLLAGSLVGFKAYGAVLIMCTLLFIAVINIKKGFSYIYIFMLSLIFTSLIFFSQFEPSQQLIIFSPFWFIHSMIDSPDRVGWMRLSLAREAGLATNNWFKFISAEVISFLIFIIGNLGLRSLSLLFLIKIKSIVKNSKFLFIFLFSVLSLLIPVLFIQSGNPWNTIQFTYYGLYMAALISGMALAYFVFGLPKFLTLPVILIILLLTPVNSITTATYYLGVLPHGRMDNKELEALEFLSGQEDGIVLTYPYDKKLKTKTAEPWPLYVYDSTAYVSALSKKAVFVEDEAQNQILLTDYRKRLVAAKDFFLKPQLKFIKENNIEYIYLPKVFDIRIDEDLLSVKNIFENSETIVYKVKK